MPPKLKPAPLPPPSLREQLGVPEGVSDATLQDMLYAKQPKPDMQEMFSPLEAGRNLAPAAVRAGGLIGGGALAAGTGPVGLVGAGAINVFADHLATKMEALNRGEIPPNSINISRAAPAFLSGALLAGVPVPKGPLGYVTQGLTNAAYQTGERALQGEPITQQNVGEAALLGSAMHGGFQGAGKLLSKVPMNVKAMFPAPVEGQRVPMTTEAGAARVGNDKPRTFYRGTEPGNEAKIKTGNKEWDSHLFASSDPERAKDYGSQIERIEAKPEAKILYEGTKEFNSVAKGIPRTGSLLDLVSGVTNQAKSQGYDAVHFKLQGTVGTAILNPDKFVRNAESKFGLGDVTGQEKLPKGVTKAPDWPGVGRGYHVDVGQESPTTIYVPEGEDLRTHLQKTYKDFGINPSAAMKRLGNEKGAALIGGKREPKPNEMGFYSRLQNWSENLPDQGSHNPLALANQLQKGVTSKMELDETGVLPWLREQKGKVTTQQVRDYIDQHQIKVEEKMLGEPLTNRTKDEVWADVKKALDKKDVNWWDDMGYEKGRYSSLMNDARSFQNSPASKEVRSVLGDRLFNELEAVESYHPPGEAKYNRPETLTPFEHGAEPNSYRELVMTMPMEKERMQQQVSDMDKQLKQKIAAAHEKMQKEGFDPWKTLIEEPTPEWKEINDLSIQRNRLADKVKAMSGQGFTSSHYSDIPNPLVHMRFDSRIAPDGKKVLFIHEIQSDWHQRGREEGYQNPRRLDELDAKLKKEGKLPPDEAAEYNNLTNREAFHSKTGVPAAPFKQTPEWTGLAAKRLLRYAAENGYDRVAWTPGEAQAERYDLSKHIDKIESNTIPNVSDAPENTMVRIRAYGKNGEVVMNEQVPPSKVADYIGKELAEKVNSKWGKQEFSGLDLKVGGEGMKGFYGSPEKGELGIVGGVMNDLGKKWGSKVGTSGIPTGKEGVTNFYAEKTPNGKYAVREVGNQEGGGRYYKWVKTGLDESTAKKIADEMKAGVGHKVHSLDLPASMKEEVKTKGQPIAGLLPTLLGKTEATA